MFLRFVLTFLAVKAKRETQLIMTKEEPHQHRKLKLTALFPRPHVPGYLEQNLLPCPITQQANADCASPLPARARLFRAESPAIEAKLPAWF